MKYSHGFTLVELLVVIAIIGVLASIVLASLSSAQVKGQDAARTGDVKSLETALELYYAYNGGYPTSAGSSNGDVALNDPTLVSKLVPAYISSMPAILISDGDHYYTNGMTTGVSTIYDMLIYRGETNTFCRAGVAPNQVGDWGIPTVCNF
jgi:prepilin-type N-terminal cleavage/methylation domain-containing protein